MSFTSIPAQFNDRCRRFIDRLTRCVVRFSGLAILLVIMLLFIWLLWVEVPLLSSPSMGSPDTLNPQSPWGWMWRRKWGRRY